MFTNKKRAGTNSFVFAVSFYVAETSKASIKDHESPLPIIVIVQTVICEGATSTSSPVTSGVPQGSVLGPLLFLTYINDLPDGLASTVKLFADDTLLYGVVVDDSDCDNLQDDLNKLEIWQNEWQMEFNPSKCNIMRISNKQRPPQRTYFFCGSKLEQVDSASYLGITVNSKLKWSEHISSISSKASRSLGLIKRNL